MKDQLTKKIESQFACNASAQYFLKNIMKNAEVYLFGGAVRDYLDGKIDASRDIDIVVESNTNTSIDILEIIKQLNDTTFKINRFNGYKINFNNQLYVDIWNLLDTWAFKTNEIEPSALNLMKSVYLNIDALVYSLNNSTYLNNCDIIYENTIKNNKLDIVFDKTPYEDLNLLRALVFQKKYSLKFSQKLSNRIIQYIRENENSVIDNFMKIQIIHYNQVVISNNEIKNIINKL